MTEVGPAYTAGAHFEWVRRQENFLAGLEAIGEEFQKRRRGGPPWSNFGPGQLEQHATDRRRGSELVGRLLNPSRSPMAAVLPLSLRPLLWPLAYNPALKARIPDGQPLLRREAEELQGLCLRRLVPPSGRDPLSSRERTRRGRLLQKLDTDRAPIVTARLADCSRATRDPRSGLVSPASKPLHVGDDVSVNATALASFGVLVVQPSTAGYPVLARAVEISGEHVSMFVL